METFRRKDEILEKRLVEERARREQISVSFLSLLKDMTVELEAHCNSQRRQSCERLNDRFAKTAARLSALQERIPRECEEMVTDITKQTDELRAKVDRFLVEDVAGENTECKQRHSVLMEAIGNSAVSPYTHTKCFKEST